MREDLHKELKRLSNLGISVALNYDADEWNVWHADTSKSWAAWGHSDLNVAIEKLIEEIRRTAREILELE